MPLSAIPQVVITISIDGDSSRASVSYSYIDPFSGKTYINSATCVLPQIVPAYCIFALDYASSGHGWVIDNLSPTNGTPPLAWELSKNKLSATTEDLDPYLHTFTISFRNAVTGEALNNDPQEGNIPIPVKSC
jgi:hypothetical protein